VPLAASRNEKPTRSGSAGRRSSASSSIGRAGESAEIEVNAVNEVTDKTIRPSKEAIADFCRRHRIRKLSLFGSVLRDDFRPESDIDVLVEFEPGHAVGWGIIDIEEELSQLFGGHKVDMVREKYLNPRLRDRILASAEVQYAEG
jgi:uncharacterized protein